MKSIFWFRRDLRLHDNVGLFSALAESSQVIPVYIVEQDILKGPDMGEATLFQLFSSLKYLSEQFDKLNSKLIIRFGKPTTELIGLAKETDSKTLYFNRSYEPEEKKNEQKITDLFVDSGYKVKSFKDQVIFEGEELLTDNKKIVFSFDEFKKRWSSKYRPDSSLPLLQPEVSGKFTKKDSFIYSSSLPEPKKYGINIKNTNFEPKEAQKKLKIFINKLNTSYFKNKEMLDFNCISEMAPFLRFGNISPRECLHSVRPLFANSTDNAFKRAVKIFIEGFIRRDFYYYKYSILEKPVRQLEDKVDIRWGEWYKHFFIWCNGHTGYPVIDAVMRQLDKDFWIDDKLRWLTAHFIIHNLHIEYKWGENYFMHKLIDSDHAINSQFWSEISSEDLKLFAPVKYSVKFNGMENYIRKYVEELKNVPDEYIYEPYKMPMTLQKKLSCVIGRNYPFPLKNFEMSEEIELRKPVD